ncbi:MAG: hypothetical protein ACLRNQ_12625 [Flavonifractor plautii]
MLEEEVRRARREERDVEDVTVEGVPGGRGLVGAGVPPGAPAPVPVPELRLLGSGL